MILAATGPATALASAVTFFLHAASVVNAATLFGLSENAGLAEPLTDPFPVPLAVTFIPRAVLNALVAPGHPLAGRTEIPAVIKPASTFAMASGHATRVDVPAIRLGTAAIQATAVEVASLAI